MVTVSIYVSTLQRRACPTGINLFQTRHGCNKPGIRRALEPSPGGPLEPRKVLESQIQRIGIRLGTLPPLQYHSQVLPDCLGRGLFWVDSLFATAGALSDPAEGGKGRESAKRKQKRYQSLGLCVIHPFPAGSGYCGLSSRPILGPEHCLGIVQSVPAEYRWVGNARRGKTLANISTAAVRCSAPAPTSSPVFPVLTLTLSTCPTGAPRRL